MKTIDVDCDSVVDIGGSQLPIYKRVKSWNVRDYKILDLEQPHECKRFPDILLDINEFDVGFLNGNFDVAFMIEVMEYLYNPVRAIKNINLLLKFGGLLYISTHELYPVHNPIEFDYLRYTKNGIIKILEKCGFNILDVCEKKLHYSGAQMDCFQLEKMKNAQNEILQGAIIKAIKI
ncbi:MAG: methyltransferase domain-containing protein [bacterium]